MSVILPLTEAVKQFSVALKLFIPFVCLVKRFYLIMVKIMLLEKLNVLSNRSHGSPPKMFQPITEYGEAITNQASRNDTDET
jgi:hypothetical protein